MPPRIDLARFSQSICVRPRPSVRSSRPLPPCNRPQQTRLITAEEKPLPEAEHSSGPNQDQLPHVSEEASMTGKITGEGGPDIDQGTPVQEVIVNFEARKPIS